MKIKLITLAAIIAGVLQLNAFAATIVTGDQLDIGTSQSLSGSYNSIAGGQLDTNNGDWSTIAGGDNNIICAPESFIGAGNGNYIYADFFGDDAIGAGVQNGINSVFGFIGSGYDNLITSDLSWADAIGGGQENEISVAYSTIGGGYENNIGGTNANSSGYGVIAGGYYNTNNGYIATIGGGGYNLALGTWSTIPGGLQAQTISYGQLAYSGGSFVLRDGEAQTSTYVLRNVTTNTNSAELFLDGSAERMNLPADGTWTFDLIVTERDASGNSAGFKTNGVIKTISGTTTLLGGTMTLTPFIADSASASTQLTISAGGASSNLILTAYGNASTNRWVATVRTSEVRF